MKRLSNNESEPINRNTILTICFAIVMTSTTFSSLNAYAASQGPPDFRVAVGGDRFSDTWQFAAAYKLPPHDALAPDRSKQPSACFQPHGKTDPLYR